MSAERAHCGRILLVLYLVSVVLVCSFILFEVLDIDGSDFVPTSPLVDARPAESQDLKRAILSVSLSMTAPASPLVCRELILRRTERPSIRAALGFTSSLSTLALLPRATLGDGSAA